MPAPTAERTFGARRTSRPARGRCLDDQLGVAARRKLGELIVDAAGLQIEVARVVPTGSRQLEGRGSDERELTPARLAAVKRQLADRGVDSKKVCADSRVDQSLVEPRLEVQLGGRPAFD